MGRALRMMKWGGVGLVSLVGAALAYLFLVLPAVGPTPVLQVESTPKRLERGTYLAEHVALCVDCHSERDFSKFSGPPKRETFGRGGERFGHDLGLPGTLYSANITPAAIGDWSDGELLQTLTTGVNPDGRVLFPFMPWPVYAQLCDEDLQSLIAYVRKLAPIEHEPPRSSLDFPVNLLVRTMPAPRAPITQCPDRSDTKAYGEYLVRTASCADCHTQRTEKGEPIAELAFAGGVKFPLPTGGLIQSANLTPDERSGIGRWTREQFIQRFARFRDASQVPEVEKGSYNTFMPWTLYAGMTDEDLGAIYDYLKTQKPVYRPQTERFAAR